jgi:hypothetical protein
MASGGLLLFKTRMLTSCHFHKNLLMGDWPILCGSEQAFLGPKKKPGYHRCTLIIDGGFSF